MSVQKLKSLVIAVLFLINIFFLMDIVLSRASDATERNRTMLSLQTIMAASGIEFSADIISDVTVLKAYVTAQDAFAEAVIARAILGECEPVQSDSGRQYEGSRGTALFNTLGQFVIELTENYSPPGSSAENAVKKLLKNMGIDADDPVATAYGDTDVVRVLCRLRGSPIFNCTVTFEFSNGALLRVFGRKPSGVTESQGYSYISFSTAMLSFLRYEQENEIGSTKIVSVDPGYRMNVDAFGGGTLTPGWLIVTDSDTFFADASTGEILPNDT